MLIILLRYMLQCAEAKTQGNDFSLSDFLVPAGMPIIFANVHTKIYYNCFIQQGITHSIEIQEY